MKTRLFPTLAALLTTAAFSLIPPAKGAVVPPALPGIPGSTTATNSTTTTTVTTPTNSTTSPPITTITNNTSSGNTANPTLPALPGGSSNSTSGATTTTKGPASARSRAVNLPRNANTNAFVRITNRVDVRSLPDPLKARLRDLARRPHTYVPQRTFPLGTAVSQLTGYYLLDDSGLVSSNLFGASVNPVFISTNRVAFTDTNQAPIGSVRVLQILPANAGTNGTTAATNSTDPGCFDFFTDIAGLGSIQNESGFYEGWLIHDLVVPTVAAVGTNGTSVAGSITADDATAMAAMGTGNNVPGAIFTMDGNAPVTGTNATATTTNSALGGTSLSDTETNSTPPGADLGGTGTTTNTITGTATSTNATGIPTLPETSTPVTANAASTNTNPSSVPNTIAVYVSAGTFNALQRNDAHAYKQINRYTDWVFPLYELPFTGGLEGSFEMGLVGARSSLVPGSGPAGITNTPVAYGDNPNNPRDPDRTPFTLQTNSSNVLINTNLANPEFRLRSIPSGVAREVLLDVLMRTASFEPTVTDFNQRLSDAYAAEVAKVDTNRDGVISFEEADAAANAGTPIFIPVTEFNRFAVTREINDGMLAPRFAPSERAWVLQGTLQTAPAPATATIEVEEEQ